LDRDVRYPPPTADSRIADREFIADRCWRGARANDESTADHADTSVPVNYNLTADRADRHRHSADG
jgi:hypothetical protein